jgi:hypothetical protein
MLLRRRKTTALNRNGTGPAMIQAESAQPRIHVIVLGATTGAVLVDGVSHPIIATDDAGVREESIANITARARASGRALLVTTDGPPRRPG